VLSLFLGLFLGNTFNQLLILSSYSYAFCLFVEDAIYVINWSFVNLQTVNIKVKMDCEGCERKVKNAVKSIKGTNTI
jgi:hypothetical protein